MLLDNQHVDSPGRENIGAGVRAYRVFQPANGTPLLVELGYTVRRNDPYAGGYITRHYGRPREGIHALQIEIARELYMDEGRIERLSGFEAVRQSVTRLIAGLAQAIDAAGGD